MDGFCFGWNDPSRWLGMRTSWSLCPGRVWRTTSSFLRNGTHECDLWNQRFPRTHDDKNFSDLEQLKLEIESGLRFNSALGETLLLKVNPFFGPLILKLLHCPVSCAFSITKKSNRYLICKIQTVDHPNKLWRFSCLGKCGMLSYWDGSGIRPK